MEIAKLIVQYLQVLAWPTVCVWLVLHFLKMFRPQIELLLGRVTEASLLGMTWKAMVGASQQKQEPPKETPLLEEIGKQQPPTETPLAEEIGKQTAQSTDGKEIPAPAVPEIVTAFKEAVINDPELVLKNFLRLNEALFYEKTYNIILQAQIDLLSYLEQFGERGATNEGLYPFYARILAFNLPVKIEFKDFIKYLQGCQFILTSEDEQGASVHTITPRGRNFLSYIRVGGHMPKAI